MVKEDRGIPLHPVRTHAAKEQDIGLCGCHSDLARGTSHPRLQQLSTRTPEEPP